MAKKSIAKTTQHEKAGFDHNHVNGDGHTLSINGHSPKPPTGVFFGPCIPLQDPKLPGAFVGYIDITKVKNFDGNPTDRTNRKSSRSHLNKLKRSIEIHGQLQPCVISYELVVVIGNRRDTAVEMCGRKLLFVVWLPRSTSECYAMFADEAENQKRHNSNEKLEVFLKCEPAASETVRPVWEKARDILGDSDLLNELCLVKGSLNDWKFALQLSEEVLEANPETEHGRDFIRKTLKWVIENKRKGLIAKIRNAIKEFNNTEDDCRKLEIRTTVWMALDRGLHFNI